MIETRKTEIRYVTSDPKKMLNMYLAKRVLKTWEESFIDEDTGETVTIERNEILFDRGTLIDQDILAKIRFSREADGIREVEVSNQNRLAFENENNVLYPHIAQAEIEGNFRLNLVELPFVRLGFFIFLILFIHLIKIFFCSNLFFEVGYRSVVHLAFFQSIGETYTGIELFYHSQSESEQIV